MVKETPKKQVALLLADGFEEGEAVIVLDILERLEIQVTTLACQKNQIAGNHGLGQPVAGVNAFEKHAVHPSSGLKRW